MKKRVPAKRKVERPQIEEDARLLQLMNEVNYTITVSRSEIVGKLSQKDEILDGLKEAVDQVNLSKQGLVKMKPARELLNEL